MSRCTARTCTDGGKSSLGKEQSWQVGPRSQRRQGGAPIHAHAQAAYTVVVACEYTHLLAGEGVPHICVGLHAGSVGRHEGGMRAA